MLECTLKLFIACRAYTLAAIDASGRDYEFVIKAWANGTDRGGDCGARRPSPPPATTPAGKAFGAGAAAEGRLREWWCAGSGDRRVYVMEQAAPFIKGHRLGQGDAIGLCINGAGTFVMLVNTPQVPHHCCVN